MLQTVLTINEAHATIYSMKNKPQTFKEHYASLSASQKQDLAKSAKTSVAYLSQLANGHRKAGIEVMVALKMADPAITDAMLRPDLFRAA